MHLLLLSLALLAKPASTHAKVGPEIFVRTDPGVSLERLASAVRPMGKIETREGGNSYFLIQLNPGVNDEKAKQALEKIPGVHALEPSEEPVDMASMRSIRRKIAHLKEDDNDKDKKEDGKPDDDAGLDYLQAYQSFFGIRAFPNDSFDFTLWDRARKHALSMPVTNLRHTKSPTGIENLQSWEYMGPTNLGVPPNAIDFGFGPTNGRVNALAYDPNNSQTIYAGGAQGGVWKSTDSGSHWTWLSTGWTHLAVNQIAVDPVNTDTIYVALGDYQGHIAGSYGIMKSTDGGKTWNEIASNYTFSVGVCSLLIDPTNDQIILAGTGDSTYIGALYRSTDGGQTWNTVINPPQSDNANFPALAANVPNGSSVRMYAVEGGNAASNKSNGRVYVSVDHGKTWNFLKSPVQNTGTFFWAYSIATSPTNPNNVYILDAQNQALYSSTDNGSNWTNISANLPLGPIKKGKPYNFSQSNYDYYIACGTKVFSNKNSDALFLGLIDVQESDDTGTTWYSLGGPSWQTLAAGAITHNDQHCFAVCPTNPNLFMFGNDGGAYQLQYNTSTNSNKITSLNANLGNTMFYKIACHPTEKDWMIGGTQDNSTPFSDNNLGAWRNQAYGDGGGVAINQSNPLVEYACSENFGLYRTDDGWNTEAGMSPTVGANENLPFTTIMALDPQNQNLFYAGTNFLHLWNESTQTWTDDLGGTSLVLGANATITAIAIAPTDSKRIYTGSSDGLLAMTTNGGNTFRQLEATFVNAGITSISVNPTNHSDILVGYSGSGIQHLWRCSNTDPTGFFAYTQVSGSGSTALPDVSLNAIVRDFDDPQNTWYVATDVGVFSTTDAGTTWTNMGTSFGLPNVIVDDLVGVPGTRYLVAGTYGRGAWRLFFPPDDDNLVAFSINPSPIVGGNNTTGTVTLAKPAPASGVVVQLKGDASSTYPSSVTVPSGSTLVNFLISSAVVSANVTEHITAYQETISKEADLQILAPTLADIIAAPSEVQGGSTILCEVDLTGKAPSSNVTINLKSSNSAIKVPPTLKITAGSSKATFTISTVASTTSLTSNITASYGGLSMTQQITVLPSIITGLSLSTSSAVGGSDVTITGTISFSGPTPTGGLVVKLKSSNTTAATVPASVTVKTTGSSGTATFTVTHHLVKTPVGITISATCGSEFYTAGLSLTPFQLIGLSASPSQFPGGVASVGTVTLNAEPGTGSGPVGVQLSTTQHVIGFLAVVNVPEGSSTATFAITSKPVTVNQQAIITGVLGSSELQTTVTLTVTSLKEIAVSPTSVKGSATTAVTGGVLLSGPAPAGGIVVTLTSSDPAAASMPSKVTVAAGQTSFSFKVPHAKVTRQVTVTFTASYGGTIKTCTLVVGT